MELTGLGQRWRVGDEGEAGVKDDITFLTRAHGYVAHSILKVQRIGKGEKKNVQSRKC